jgi:hypothetical protein
MDLAGDSPGYREKARSDRRLVYDPAPAPPAQGSHTAMRPPAGGPGVRRVRPQGFGATSLGIGPVVSLFSCPPPEIDGF